MSRHLAFIGLIHISLAFLSHARAGETITPQATGLLTGNISCDNPWDLPWSLTNIYRNPAHPYLQDLSIVGQLQNQYAYGIQNSESYSTADLPESSRWGNIEVRRFRLGSRARMFDKLSFLLLMDLNPDLEPRFYRRTPECFLTWKENDAFQISIGKTELKFDREQEYSSKEFPLFERTTLGNMFYGGELLGIWTSGKGIAGGWLYFLGIHDNDRQDEWSDFQGGTMILGKIGYNYSDRSSLDLAEIKLQILHNTEPGFSESPGDLASPQYSTCLSLSHEWETGPYGLTVEALWGDGANGRSNVLGISAMPFWNISKNLQWISDLELAASSQDNGILMPGRYEALATGMGDSAGDCYFAAYSGLTWFLRGHDLKLMSGMKYAHMSGGTGGGDFSGWTWLAGMRLAF